MIDFTALNILVLGDVMIDRYWTGSCDRVSPEAPVPVVKVSTVEDRLGGAANAALNLSTLGCKVSLCGLTGSDDNALILKQLLDNAAINNLCKSWLEKTTVKLRVMAHSQQLIRVDFEDIASSHIASDFSEFIINDLILDEYDLILVSDYLKGSLQFVDKVLEKCKSLGKKVVVDPKNPDPFAYLGAQIMTPNRKEFEQLVGAYVSDADLEEQALVLLNRLNLEALVVTLSSDGVLCVTQDETRLMPTVAREVVDVTGAGDVFVSTLSAMYASGTNLFEACSFANVAAGLSVEKVGTVSLTSESIYGYNTFFSSNKLFESGEQLHDHIMNVHNKKKTVFTNGCFDVLHAGHVDYLRNARQLGEILIIGINDDASVERLKGNNRPINSLAHRIELLSALEFVDFIVPFSEDTPFSLINALSPDTLVKGGDYKVENIVGYDYVTSYGGHVTTLPFIDGLSSSSIIKKLSS